MKKELMRFCLSLAFLLFAGLGASAQEPYAVLSDDNTTLTFYYDDNKASRNGMSVHSGSEWNGQKENITTVVFDASFADCTTLTSTAYWFYGCTSLTTITGISNLKTDNVTDMSYMFSDCSNLTSLDLSNFNTANVDYMGEMFYGCSGLKYLDVSRFVTENVREMDGMFAGCSSLTSLDVSKFNTADVTSMSSMFAGCSSLTSLDVSMFNTENVTDMNYMFGNCSSLITIYCNDAWSCTNSSSMFSGCNSLVGAISYDYNKTDATYANPTTGYFTAKPVPYAVLSDDNKTLTFYYDMNKASRGGMSVGPFGTYSSSGWNNQIDYITSVVFDESFANYNELTSTAYWFCYLWNLSTITGLNNLRTDNVSDMRCMFYQCSKLTSLDVSKFNTEKVTDMSEMFYRCNRLKTIYCNDAWNCAESNNMFYGCTSLVGAISYDTGKTDATYANPATGYFTVVSTSATPYAALSESNTVMTFYYDKNKASRGGMDIGPFENSWTADWIDLSYNITTVVFDESFANYNELISTAYWFDGFSNLKTIIGMENLKTDNVTDMKNMFDHCSMLTSLDLRNFNTANVTDMSGMFIGCSSLVSIYCKDTWNCSKSTLMFYGCTSLVGAISYDSNKTDVTYANPNTGYFTPDQSASFPYAVLSEDNTTLTFYYDGNKESRGGMDVGPFKYSWYAGWDEQRTNITAVVFDESFANCTSLTSTAYWLYGCKNLTTITGISNLKTDNVTDMGYMFAFCSGLTSLDVSKFSTSNVTNMKYMFGGCSGLTSLDVSNFNTANVTDMSSMFYNCSKLKTICCKDAWTCTDSDGMFHGCTSLTGAISYDTGKTDATYANPTTGYFTDPNASYPYAVLSEDNTTLTFYYDKNKYSRDGMGVGPFSYSSYKEWDKNSTKITTVVFDESFADYDELTSTAYWFNGCYNLTTITGVGNLKTDNVTDMGYMFAFCFGLTSLDVSKFNTANVTNMDNMFAGCSSLTSLDVSNFNTSNVSNMSCMFRSCYALETIYCDDAWICEESTDMFADCTSLVGAISYDSNKSDATYANPTTGYFTETGIIKETYAVLSEDKTTLTFYYDQNKESRGGMDVGLFDSEENRGWNDYSSTITSVVFDASFAVCTTLAGTAYWFYNCTNLSTITGISNLRTYNVIDMSFMFYNCSKLTSLDLSKFNTANVIGMHYLFYNCSGLTSLDVSNFNTTNVTNMNSMFAGCSGLTSLDVSNLNTENVKGMGYMFSGCSGLTSLNVARFNTANVTSMNSMFAGCSNLTTIYCNDSWNCSKSSKMFDGCTSLVGAISYDGTKTDATYANPTTGYFTQCLVLDEGYFVVGSNPNTGLEYDFDNAVEFNYDKLSGRYIATIGKKDAYVSQIMISTVRGDDDEFKSHTLKPEGTITDDPYNWLVYIPSSNAVASFFISSVR